MPYTYEYLSNEEQISLIQAKLKNAEERMLELELADQDDVTDITATITSLKAKLTELEG